MAKFNPRWVIGQTITSIEMNKFETDCSEHPFTFDPVICFNNGARLGFTVAETENGVYGIEPFYIPPPRRRR